MSKVEKRLKKWKSSKQPAPVEEVMSILKRFFAEVRIGGRGSHIITVEDPRLASFPGCGPLGAFTIPVKSGQTVQHWYLKDILAYIEYIEDQNI